MPIWVASSVRFLEGMFIVGTLGTAIILVLSGIEDIETFLGMDKEKKTF